MQYIVAYTSLAGAIESFGPFPNYDKAEEWMKKDLEWASKNMSLAAEIKAEPWIDGNKCGIEEVGEWEVIELIPPDDIDSARKEYEDTLRHLSQSSNLWKGSD